MPRLLWLLPILLLAALLLRLQRRRPVLQYLFFCRYPLLVGLALVLVAPLALAWAASLLRNLLALSAQGIYLVSLLAACSAAVVLITLEVILRYGPARFESPGIELPAWVLYLRFPSAVLLALPLTAAAIYASPGPLATRLGMALGGWLTAVVIFFLSLLLPVVLGDGGPTARAVLSGGLKTFFLHSALAPRIPLGAPVASAPPPAEVPPHLRGYVDPRTGNRYPGHLLAFVFLATTFTLYLLGYFFSGYLLRHAADSPVPALAYVLLMLVLAGWALPGLSFLLDRYRVPTLLPLVALSFASSWLFQTDHYFRVLPLPPPPPPAAEGPAAAEPAAAPPEPTEAFRAAESAQDVPRRPVVVVAASGGGITAAVWTARVLTALQAEVGTDFTRSIRLISSASGGSVGTLFFLDRFDRQGHPPAEKLAAIVDAAASPSLDAVAWGLAYPDLWRTFAGFVLRDKTLDRGWALEQAWRERLENPDLTLAGWQQRIREGWLPAAVLNSTVVEDGEPIWLTGLDLSPSAGGKTFFQTFPEYDLPVSTAARLSATFPWVSPISRALGPGGAMVRPGYHFADGGYFDNFGIVTIVHWLGELKRRELEQIKQRGLLLIQIRAFPPREDDADPDADRGWFFATLGPMITLLNVMGPSQSGRNATEVRLMLEQLTAELGIEPINVQFVLQVESPLSWKLTREEKDAIIGGFREQQNQESLARVKAAFRVP